MIKAGTLLRLTFAASLLACSHPEGAAPEDVGEVAVELMVGGDVTLDSVAFDVSGNGFHRTGSLNVAGSSTISGRLSGIPAGVGYTLSLSASGGTATCQGAAPFDVMAGGSSAVVVRLQCKVPPKTGSVQVTGTTHVCPTIQAVDVLPAEVTVGHAVSLSATAGDQAARSYAWTTTSGTLVASAAGATLTCTTAGIATVSLTVSDGECSDSTQVTVTCSPAVAVDAGLPPGPSPVKINEVESNGGVPGDWVELYNPSSSAADVSGFVFKDGDDTHAYVIPAGTVIAPGAFLVLEEASFVFGLGAADAARLYDGVILVDSYSWTAHAPVTYGRCPDGAGAFGATALSTKGSPNACGAAPDAGPPPPPDAGAPDGGLTFAPWPGPDQVVTVDQANQFGTNMSGLSYQAAGATAPPVLWAVQNSPSKIYRLLQTGPLWTPDPAGGWGAGKVIHYPGGTGAPDSEGITRPALDPLVAYVATERDNDHNTVSRLSVLRVDTTGPGVELTASHEWNLTADLPPVGANLGLEAIAWVPDDYLVSSGFQDESLGQPYNPERYPAHGGGLFLVGVEASGAIYAYALEHGTGAAHKVATLSSGQPAVMDLAWDSDLGGLWAGCDNTCGNKLTILAVETNPASPDRGHFVVRKAFARPSTLPDVNNEGVTFAPTPECADGLRRFFWSDDDQTSGHALRMDAIPCGPLF